MSRVKIESGIPIPPVKQRDTHGFGQLEVGQSFTARLSGDFLPNGKRPEYNRWRTAATRYGKKHGKKFAIRIMPEEGVLRIWRVS
ncbi:MAG: hypothetical protein PWP11_3271 [Thauera sp.]|nr:hypothetical protein [Thauera sp.]MDI3491994.1 hypothetical protein [Thauera sp.]